MNDPIHLIDAKWRDLSFQHNLVMPDEALPDLDGLTLAVDVETRPVKQIPKAGLSAFHGEILGVSVGCPEKQQCWYVPLKHQSPGSERFNHDPYKVRTWLGGIMPRASLIVNHNLKFDAKFVDRFGVPATSYDHVPLYDTQIGNVLIDERVESGLKPSSHRILNLPPDEEGAIKPFIVGNKDMQDWSYIPADLMAPYGCGDVERTLRLAGAQRAMLAREEVEDLMRLELRVLRDLIHMELRGHRVDLDALKHDLPNMIRDELMIAKRIEQLCGASINYESPQEIAEAFVSRLGLPIISHKPGKSRDGKEILSPVFDDTVLQSYGRHYPEHAELMFRIRQARRLATIKGYLQSYVQWQVDGVIHTTIKQVEARTGRESSEMPNLQNVSGEEEWQDPTNPDPNDNAGKWIAPGCDRYFIAREGHTILSFDYSQIEYRFFAHYLNDERLLKAYREDPSLDMHEWTAREILENLITRDDAKSANFGIVFGMGEKKLIKFMATNGVDISEEQSARVLKTYKDRIPFKELQNDVGAALVRRGHVKTILGRRRRVTKFLRKWDGARDKKKDRGLEPYQALNAICQGGGVDLLKHRSTAARGIVKKQFGGEVILKIHDDLKSEVPNGVALECARALKPILETFVKPDGSPYLKLPIYTKCTATRTSWYDATKLDLN